MSPTLPTYGSEGAKFQFTSLTQGNRTDLVDIAGNQAPGYAYANAIKFSLTALGANVDIEGNFKLRPNPPVGVAPNDLVNWKHITTSGRDQHVKVAYGGFLYPTGNEATLIIISERVLEPDPVSPSTHAVAFMQIRAFIRVTQPVKTYPAYDQPYGLNAWPFTEVECLSLVSPDLDPPSAIKQPTYLTDPPKNAAHVFLGDYPQAFFPSSANGVAFKWTLRFTDTLGNKFTTSMPLAFVFSRRGAESSAGVVPQDFNIFDGTEVGLQALATAYNALGQNPSGPDPLVTGPAHGKHITLAPEVIHNGSPKAGATTHPLMSIVLGAASTQHVPPPRLPATADQQIPDLVTMPSPATMFSVMQPNFYPSLMIANVRLPAAEALSRAKFNDSSGNGVALFYFGKYVTDGFVTSSVTLLKRSVPIGVPIDPAGTTNLGSVYSGLLEAPTLSMPSDTVGGLANPNLGVAGLSGAAGAIGGPLSNYASAAKQLPTDYFGSLLSAQIFGGLKLADLLKGFLNDLGLPEMTRQIAADGTVTITYTLSAALQSFGGIFNPLAANPPDANAPNGKFVLTATVTINPAGTSTFVVSGSIDSFTIDIMGGGDAVISIPFGDGSAGSKGAEFSSGTNKKSDIKVHVGQPSFEGALAFVNTLEQFLSDIGGSGVSINVGPTQISAGISLSLPSIGCGVFNLEDLSLSASVVIPFLGDPAIATFGFCSQEKPFSLTVMCFGGGGYVLVGVGFHSLESLTASLDFKGELAIDIGVASGGISAMAGITFSYVKNSGSTLTGFVKLNGHLSVLGIISVSIELDLTLTYVSSTNQTTGTATMTISVSVFFFSISVPFTVQKTFNGGSESNHAIHAHGSEINSRTQLADQLSKDDWAAYCSAFAA